MTRDWLCWTNEPIRLCMQEGAIVASILDWHLGRILLSLAFVVPVVVQCFADFSKTHIFNSEWLPHARFHNATQVFQLILSLPFTLWLLWLTPTTPDVRMLTAIVALAMPIVWGIPFFLALLVPGTSFEAYPYSIPWVGPLPVNIFAVCVIISLAVLGFFVDRWEARRFDVSAFEVETTIAGVIALFLALAVAGILIIGWRNRRPILRS
jgi:hypothetical protein